MVTKETIRISGIYGKRIIDSIPMPLVRQTENTWQYKLGNTNFFFYPKSKKIYVSGDDSEKIYVNILEKINTYLQNLATLPEDENAKIFLSNCLERNISLFSNYHIFNMEVLTTLATKKYERLEYAETFISSSRYLTLSFYEELMLYLIYCDCFFNIQDLCQSLMEERSEVKKEVIWNRHYECIPEEEKQMIKKKIEKMSYRRNL